MLLLLATAWIVVLKNQLWQHWLRRHYQAGLDQVSQQLDLQVRRGWRARLEAVGRQGKVRISVQWRAGVGPHRLLIKVRRKLRRRKWVGRADTEPEEVRRQVERLVADLGG